MGGTEACVGREAPPPPPQGPSHASLPDALALAARAGEAVIRIDDHAPPTNYTPGSTHKLSIGPSNGGSTAGRTWFLVDTGVGTLSPLADDFPSGW